MTAARRRWLVGGAAAVVVLLFAGQWCADLLADRWWAGALIPEGAAFVSGVRLLRLTLDVAAVLVATAWFTGHLLVVHRAIGSVQISRQVANLEIREAVTPASLLPLALGIGLLLGLVAGLGAGRDWATFALAWQGVAYGVTDPFLHKDLGVFVAQLPLWTWLHAFARLLAWGAVVVVLALYAALGAVRWHRGRPAISGHARLHLGFVLAGAALVMAWGFLLEPYSAAGSGAAASAWTTLEMSTMALAGACLAAAGISALWALRGQHLLMLAGWGVLLAGIVAVSLVLPRPATPAVAEPEGSRAVLDRIAYGLDRLEDLVADPAPAGLPAAPSLWSQASVGRLVTADSEVLEAAAPTVIPVGGTPVAVWLVVRAAPSGPASVLAIADQATDAGAGPLTYRVGDSLAYPGLVSYLTLGPRAARPGAPRLVIDSGGVGPVAGGPLRRVVLAWALQSRDLLADLDPRVRVRWRLGPRARLEALAPFVSWDDPSPLMVGGSVAWVAHGYLASRTLPGSTRIPDGAGGIGALEAGLVGVVDAASGATAIYLAPDAGPLSRAWSVITQGMIRPSAELPEAVAGRMPYPTRLFAAQAEVLEGGPWSAGELVGRTPDGRGDPLPATFTWSRERGAGLVAAYERGDDRRVRTLLLARSGTAGRTLTLVRLDDAGSLPGPSAAQATWDRFPSYEQLLDSVVRRGERFERGPYRVLPWGDAPIAYQPWYAYDAAGGVTQPYLSVAEGARVGAGRSFGEAWENLQGAGSPPPPGFGPLPPLEEARRWMQRADSALHVGDWEGFGRAFDALRRTLGARRAGP